MRRFQQRVAVNLGISAADIGNGILHGPIVGIVLIAAQRKLQDMSGGRHIVQVDGGIPIPLVPNGRFITLHSQRGIQRELIAETLAETCIDVQRFFPFAGFHISEVTGGIITGCQRSCIFISQLFAGLRVVVILVTVVDAGGIDNTVIQSPTLVQAVFLRQKHFPAVDALTVLCKEVKLVVFQQAAVQQLVGRRTVVRELHTGFHAERRGIVQPAVVKPVGTVAQRGGLLRTVDIHPVVRRCIVTVINKAQLMVFSDSIIGSHPETMRMRTAAAYLIGCHRVHRAIRQSVHSIFVRRSVSTAVFVRVKKIR